MVNPRPQRRGAELFARDLADGLRERGHALREVYLYPAPPDGGLPPSPDAVHLASRPSRLERLIGWSPHLARRLRAELARFRPDVIQASGGGAVKYAALIGSRLPQRPLIVYRNINEPGKWVNGWRRRLLYYRFVFPRVTAASVVAGSFVDAVGRICPNARPVRHIPRGLDPAALSSGTDPATVRAAQTTPADATVTLFAGRLSREKRVDRLLSAFDEATRELPEAVLWIAGDGPLKADLRAQTATLTCADRVRFLGSRDDVADLLRASDLVALASDAEGIPGFLREAALLGRAAVATRAGATDEIVLDGRTGLLVEREDEPALAAALKELLTDEERRRGMGTAAERHFAEVGLSIAGAVAAHEELYRDGIARLRTGEAK